MDKANLIQRIRECGIVAADSFEAGAAEKARAMLAGGVDVLEVRSSGAHAAIREILASCPEAIVGAGNVRNAKDCAQAISAGARFVCTYGVDEGILWECAKSDALYIPSCATAGEVRNAAALGLSLVRLFPASLCGGVQLIRALVEAFDGLSFIPESGVTIGQMGDYACLKGVAAMSVDWLCEDFETGGGPAVQAACERAVTRLMGFELYHLGLNAPDASAACALSKKLEHAFGFPFAEGPFAYYSSRALQKISETLYDAKGQAVDARPGAFYWTSDFEIMKRMYRGGNGHLGIRTNDVNRAIAYLAKRGYRMDEDTAYRIGDRIFTVYMAEGEEFGGFAVHLIQK